jgi:hypothetical protein
MWREAPGLKPPFFLGWDAGLKARSFTVASLREALIF